MTFEDEYQDVLHNIEEAIVSVYRDNRELTDYQVDNALAALQKAYRDEGRGRPASPPPNPITAQVYESVQGMCEWHLGRSGMINDKGEESYKVDEPISVDEIIACLKRIRRSVEMWTKEGGRQGYLHFISNFMP